ncbi:cell cycle checkpoint control protein RAD9B isoform X3 [Ornithorhynchus anatinus]|uniref:cell cycle checkpoint control protein RAD9B isoform X1 n=1 Tax=Ornithorhynchus anatinus TaxID=9258 RepID=UPI0010A94D89|nr:cell cycle checkpoint control protein RAD9B isoform X1 [Ornithorhynchus anatinus]XP_028914652.1 cell cycle checkpoint control protein RAD9B isoform X2 [Ornithorhynchus anatinus]XP_039766390.1 cell cycle checkpoint control protein RAD9B isoform X3 [Ornithorhynchus anatinus]
MKCVIGSNHIKVFGRAIHALARISDEFWLDPSEKGLALRSMNSSRSAYACVFFPPIFFQMYHSTTIPEGCEKYIPLHLKYKLGIKSVLPIFRSLNTLERNVEKCSIFISDNNCRVVFQLFCKHGIIKTHNLVYEECEPFQAIISKHMCPNILKIPARLIADIMIHFPTHQEEITLVVTPMKACFKSYSEEIVDFTKTVHTEMCLNPDEFDYFQVGVDCNITFCLKQLRGLLAFSEATSSPVTIHFALPGKPVVFSIDDMALEASFVLATLAAVQNITSSPQSLCYSQRLKRSHLLKSNSEVEHTVQEPPIEGAASKRPYYNERQSDAPELASLRSAAVARSETHDSRIIEDHNKDLEEDMMSEASGYGKFQSLFFGAISPMLQNNFYPEFSSLVTPSDNEDDLSNGQLSQTF